MLLHFNSAVLPLFKKYIYRFESSEPLVQVLHDKQVKKFTDFLSGFSKPEMLVGKSPKDLKTPNLADIKKRVAPKDMFVGRSVHLMLSQMHKDDSDISSFLEKDEETHVTCAEHSEKKNTPR